MIKPWDITFQDIIIRAQERPLEALLEISVLIGLFSCQTLKDILARILGDARSCLR